MISDSNIDRLITKVLLNEASEDEILEFYHWIESSENKLYFEQAKLLWVASAQKAAQNIPCNLKSKNQFLSFIQKEQKRRKLITFGIISTAAALSVFSFLVWHHNTSHNNKDIISNITKSDDNNQLVDKFIRKINHEDIVLVTSDGNEHILDKTLQENERKNIGMVTDQLITHLTAAKQANEDKPIEYNILSVPRGKRFCIELSDGTVMWVNSDTKVKYPVTFHKDKREVWVEGNAYFDVAKDKNHPFSVKTGIITTVVLGTIFEVENYDNFRCKITLMEGAVKVDNTQEELILKPSQQAVIEAGMKKISCDSVDIDKYGRWKDNLLVFDKEPLYTLLAKLSRWHNVDIINNAHELDNICFSGTLSDVSLNEHLKIIANNIKIKYIIKDKNVYIGT